ncbi:MAG: CotH kinase family protein [Muribaculaceae bacterium]|nr:CotH kinase family protein [Muribaculaceae bacterium]
MRKFLLSTLMLCLIMATSAQEYCTSLGWSTKTDRALDGLEITSTSGQRNIDIGMWSRTDGDCYRGVMNSGDPVVFAAGDNINLLVNGEMNWTYIHVFVDWNCDKDFDDSGEYVEKQPASRDYFPYGEGANPTNRTFNFNVPTNAATGLTRMRVILAYGIDGACTLVRTNDAAIAVDVEVYIGSTVLETERTVTVESANAEEGSAVISDTNETTITSDQTSISVTAVPVSGYTFKNWTNKETGDVVSTSNPYYYRGEEDITLVANFQDQYVQLTNLPTIFINTKNGVGVTSKEDYVEAYVTVRGAKNAEDNITEVLTEIKGRGNSTWGMAKKPYRLKFNKKIKFLGNEAKEKNWVLLANYADKTLLRNALAFETARNMFDFEFTPSVTFVDVVLNGKNLGNYTLTDQVEVKSKRVNVLEQETTVTAADPEITGGYLIEVDGFADSEISWFQTTKGMKVTIKYPKDDEINSAQSNYIANYTQQMENALFSTNYTNAETGWRKYIDEASMVDWYIACELFGNSDSWWSTYMYKERDEVFKFGPLWDFDIAFNNDDRLGDATQKLMRTYAHDPKTWIARWWQDAGFQANVKARWGELRAKGLKSFMNNYITEAAELLDESQENNFTVWNILSSKVYRELAARGSYEAEVNFLKQYVVNRISYLDGQWGLPTGIESSECNTSTIIAPNPVENGNDINVFVSDSMEGAVNVMVASVDGKVVYSANEYMNMDNNITVSTNGWAKGMYIIVVKDNKGTTQRGTVIVK